MELRVPALRERKDDIKVLCEYFVNKSSGQGYGNVTEIDSSVYPILYSYSWPGNVRELEHVIECGCLMAKDNILKPENLDFLWQKISEADPADDKESSKNPDTEIVSADSVTVDVPAPVSVSSDLTSIVSSAERDAIMQAMEASHFKVTDAAKLLNINRTSLYRKLKAYRIYPYEKG